MTITTITLSSNGSYVLFKLSSWSSPLLAVGLLALWLNMKTAPLFKKDKLLVAILISCLTVTSSITSHKFLTRFFNDPPHQPPYFVSTHAIIELDNMDDQGRFLYDTKWSENLAPWKNIPIIGKTQNVN